MKKNFKLILLSIIFVIIFVIFILPNPNAYLLLSGVDGDTKDYYSLYKTYQINKIIDGIQFRNEDIEKVYAPHNIVLGPGSAVIIDGKIYCLYRAKNDNEVVITKNDNESESFAIIKEYQYNHLSKFINYPKIDDLAGW